MRVELDAARGSLHPAAGKGLNSSSNTWASTPIRENRATHPNPFTLFTWCRLEQAELSSDATVTTSAYTQEALDFGSSTCLAESSTIKQTACNTCEENRELLFCCVTCTGYVRYDVAPTTQLLSLQKNQIVHTVSSLYMTCTIHQRVAIQLTQVTGTSVVT